MSSDYEADRRENARAFQDHEVAHAYRLRPPYPDALFARLSEAVVGTDRWVLDLGCGTGDISRQLAQYVNHIDAVDFSEDMIEAGKAAPNGDSPKIAWHCYSAEEFPYHGPYGLAVAAESLGWMELPVVLRKLSASLHPDGLLALIERNENADWSGDFAAIIPSIPWRSRIDRGTWPRN